MPIQIIFVGIGLWLVFVLTWTFVSRAAKNQDLDRIKSRLAGTSKDKAEKKGDGKTPALFASDVQVGAITGQLLKRFDLLPKLNELIEQAGLRWQPVRVIHTCLAMFLAGFAILWIGLPPELRAFSWAGGLLGGSLPILYVLRARGSRMHKFEEQFPDSLEFVSRSMRAGHAFSVSLEMLHREFQEPLSGEFRRTFEEHNLGLPLDVALEKLAKRVPLLDVHFFVSAVLLQKRTGGNLAEILDKLAYVIRERFKLRGRIRAVSAHGKMTATALSCIPIAVAVLMFFANPDYVRFFFLDDVGQMMFGSAVVLQLIGYGVMQQIVKIEV